MLLGNGLDHMVVKEGGSGLGQGVVEGDVGDSTKGGVGCYGEEDLLSLAVFYQLGLLEVWVDLNLEHSRLYLGIFHQIHNVLTIIIRYPNVLDQTLLDQLLHGLPGFPSGDALEHRAWLGGVIVPFRGVPAFNIHIFQRNRKMN